MKTITEDLIKTALYLTRDYTMAEIAGILDVRVEELRAACVEGGVNLIGCQMKVDLFGFTHDDFIPEVKEYCGAAHFLPIAKDADVCLFI